ncbi:hypothetical protein GCM10010483_04060 [Actinokineospora diospyrosa]
MLIGVIKQPPSDFSQLTHDPHKVSPQWLRARIDPYAAHRTTQQPHSLTAGLVAAELGIEQEQLPDVVSQPADIRLSDRPFVSYRL